MYYNTIIFGKSILDIRKKLKLTQSDICELTGINVNTIRRLENGKVYPKPETLDLLSVVYKQDISQVFLNCRMDDYKEFNSLLAKFDAASEASDMVKTREYLHTLTELEKSEMNIYYRNLLKQMIYLIEGSIPYVEGTDYEAAKDLFLKGLRMTISEFNYENYADHVYNKLELQILMNLASIESDLKNPLMSFELIEHCVRILDKIPELNQGILPSKIYYTASTIFHLNQQYEKSLDYAVKGIEYNNLTRSQFGCGHLYARKGFAELNLNYDSEIYLQSFRTAAFYHDVLNQPQLKTLLNRMLDKRGITL